MINLNSSINLGNVPLTKQTVKNSFVNKSNYEQKQQDQVYFAGNPINLIKNENKITKFSEKLIESTNKFIKKLTGKNEFPITSKSYTADATLRHTLPDGITTVDLDVPDNTPDIIGDPNNVIIRTKNAIEDASNALEGKEGIDNLIKTITEGPKDIVEKVMDGVGKIAEKIEELGLG